MSSSWPVAVGVDARIFHGDEIDSGAVQGFENLDKVFDGGAEHGQVGDEDGVEAALP